MANGNLTTSLSDSLWRVVTEPLDPKPAGAILIRETPNLDATVMQALMATQLSTLTVTNPVADGQTYTGLWVNSKPEAIPTEGDDRRWFSLRQTLTKVTDATTYATLPSTYLELYGKEALIPFALVEGTGDEITRMWLYLNPAREATLAALAVGDITPPAGYAEKQRKLEIEQRGDRTLTLTVLFRKVTWTNTLTGSNIPTTAHAVEYRGANSEKGMGSERTNTYFGVPVASAETAVNALKTYDTAAWRAVSASFVQRANGEGVVTQEAAAINTANTANDALVQQMTRNLSGAKKGYIRFWPNLTPTVADALIATLETSSTFAVSGTTYTSVQIQRNSDPKSGLVTVTQVGDNPSGGSGRYGSARVYLAQQHFISTTAGDVYRVSHWVKVTSSQSDAEAWAGNSTLTRPTIRNDDLSNTCKGVSLAQDPASGMWKAVQEIWLLIAAPATESNFSGTAPT